MIKRGSAAELAMLRVACPLWSIKGAQPGGGFCARRGIVRCTGDLAELRVMMAALGQLAAELARSGDQSAWLVRRVASGPAHGWHGFTACGDGRRL